MLTSICYPSLCDMLEMQLKPELNLVLCQYFLQIGRSIDIFRGVYTSKLLEQRLRDAASSSNSSKDSSEPDNNSVNFQITYPMPETKTNSQSV